MVSVTKYVRRYWRRLFSRDRFEPSLVPNLHLETTNVCNSDCVFCANSKMRRKKTAMDFDSFRRVVDQFVEMGGRSIDFNVTIGDPLLDKRLLDRARYVRSFPQFESLGFVTTLQWLHLYDIDEFIRLFTWLSVSTSLTGDERYREFFGVDHYQQTLANLTKLIARVEESGSKLDLHIGIKPTNESIYDILSHPDFQRINELVKQNLVETVRNRAIFVDDWQGAVELPKWLKRRPVYPRFRRPCCQLYRNLLVHSNGNVAACACRDYEADSELVLGNVRDRSIGELWNGLELQQIRSNWRTKNVVPDICRSCRFYQF